MRAWLLVLAALLLASFAYADLGPKPSAAIDVTFEGAKIVGPFEAKLLSCSPKEVAESLLASDERLQPHFRILEFDAARDCYWHPAEMAWGGQCVDSQCSFTYMVPREFKVAVLLSGKQKVFVSEPATRQAFNAVFQMDIPENGFASLAETTGVLNQDTVMPFLLSLLITLALEALGTLFFFWRVKMPFNKKLLALVGAANLISLPVVWFGVSKVALDPVTGILLSEAFAVLFEAGFLFYAAKPLLTKKRALFLSVVNNALSFFIGGVLLFMAAALLNWPLY